MAESSLSISYSDLQAEVARHAAWNATPANWTATNTADFLRVLKSGLRRFYFPHGHDWSFLRVYATIVTANGDNDYTLPDNCSGRVIDESVGHAQAVANRRLQKLDEATLRAQQSMASATGVPAYYAVRPMTHAPTTGQRFEMLLYPTPSSTLTLRYAYVLLPDVITSTNVYPHGGALYSDVILEAVLAEVERLLDDDSDGPHERSFQKLLAAAIGVDRGILDVPELSKKQELSDAVA